MQAGAIIAYIGLPCSCTLVVVLMTFAIIDLKSINAVTVRLVVGFATADALTHVNDILAIGSAPYIRTIFCEAVAAISTLDRHLYAFTDTAISYHLYRAIVQLKKPSFKAELAVWTVMILFISAIMIAYHFVGAFTAVGELLVILNFTPVVSGIFVTIICHKSLGLWIESFSNKEFLNPRDQKEFKAAKSKEAQRSFLYPLAPIIKLTTEMVVSFWMTAGNLSSLLFAIDGIMMRLKGILTLFAFLIDPTIWVALKHTFSKLRSSNNIEMKDI